MHKRLVNHCTIELSLTPDGPILIKSGKEGADPTKPDMEFVETYHQGGRTIYLPGSSLKGAIRAHAERIVRTIGSDSKPANPNLLWANDPLNDNYDYLYDYLEDPKDERKKLSRKKLSPPEIHLHSSFTDRLFGNTSIASRLRIEDAYPTDRTQLKLEERNGVAIDRVFGSVAVGPFNYQVCTGGEFKTKIHLKNFTLAQLGLIGLVLRDLNDGWFGLGFAKSRGLGTVEVRYDRAVVQYPACVLNSENRISLLGHPNLTWENTALLGVGAFLEETECDRYGFPEDPPESTPVAAEEMPLGFGVQLIWHGDTVTDLFERSVKAWKKVVMSGATS